MESGHCATIFVLTSFPAFFGRFLWKNAVFLLHQMHHTWDIFGKLILIANIALLLVY